MTREEQLKSCTICTHRCMDIHKGVLCGLTNEFADFEGSCPNFEQDWKKVQKQEYKRHGYKWNGVCPTETEIINAAIEYVEGLFSPKDFQESEYEFIIDCYTSTFCAGADYYRLHKNATSEEIKEMANQYGRNMVVDPDDNLDAVDFEAYVFGAGVTWYQQYRLSKFMNILPSVIFGFVTIALVVMLLIIFSAK